MTALKLCVPLQVPLGKDGDVLEVPEEATPEAPVDGPVPRHGGVC